MTRRKVTFASLQKRQHLRKRTVRRYLQRQIAQEVAQQKKASKQSGEIVDRGLTVKDETNWSKIAAPTPSEEI